MAEVRLRDTFAQASTKVLWALRDAPDAQISAVHLHVREAVVVVDEGTLEALRRAPSWTTDTKGGVQQTVSGYLIRLEAA